MKLRLRSLLLAIAATIAAFGATDRADAQVSTLVAPSLVALAPSGSNLPDLKVGVMNLIPDDALGFVVATDVLETKKEGETVLKKLRVPMDDDDYAEFNAFLEKLEGWDSKAAHAVIMLPGKDDGDDSEGVFLVPVTDYKKFAASMGADPEAKGPTKYEIEDGPDGLIAEKANYAVLGGVGDIEAIQRVLDSKKSIGASCDVVKPYLKDHKTALVIAPAGVKKLLDSAIDGLKTLRDSIPADGPQGESIKQAFEIYDKLFVALREEATHIAVAGAFNEKVGADYSVRFYFKPDGKLAALSKDIESLPPDAFAGLPADAYIFAGAGVMPESIGDALSGFMLTALKAMPKGSELDPENAKQAVESMQRLMKNIKRTSMTVNFAGETFLSGIAAIYTTKDSAEFLKEYEKSMKMMEGLAKKNKDLPSYSVEKKTIDGLEVLVLVTDLKPMFEQMEKAGGDGAKKMYQAMFGGEKMNAYLTAVDMENVAVTYDLKALKELVATIKAGKSGLGDNLDMKKTAALLLKQPHAIGFMDVGGYIDLAKKIGSMMFGAGGGGGLPFPIPPFPPSPPVGVAGKLTPQAVEFQLVVPMPLMENVRAYIDQVNTIIGGGQLR
jgi:hypothetical protein